MSNCTYKVKIKDIQNNYKVIMEDIQNKYKFKIFCTGNSYDDTEIREEIEALQDELDDTEEELEQYKTIYNALPKVTGEGSNIALNNTANSVMIFKEYKGDTYQETTTGKNLFDGVLELGNYNSTTGEKLANNNYIINTNLIPVNEFTNYKISLNGSGIGMYVFEYKSDYSYNLTTRKTIDANSYLTTNSGTKYIAFRTIDTNTDTTLKIQVETGTTASYWEKYTGGNPSPNPDYPQNIEVVTGNNDITICGKNLFDKDSEDIGYVYSSTGSYDISALWNTSDWIKASDYITVSASTTGSINMLLSEFDNSKTFTQRTQQMSTSKTYTLNTNTRYVRLSYKNDIGINNIQIEQGSTATTYEAYTGTTYPVNLGKNLFDKDNAMMLDNYYINGSGGFTASNGYHSIYLPCEPNTTYTISWISVNPVNKNRCRIATCNTTVTSSSTLTLLFNGTNAQYHSPQTITTPYDAKYLVFDLIEGAGATTTLSDLMDSIQVEKGSTATDYAPYFNPIELCKISTYQDKIYKQNDKWYLEKNVGKTIINGTETIITMDERPAGLTYYSCNIYNTNFTKPSSECYCDKLAYSVNSIYSNDIQGIKPTSNGKIKIKVFDSSLSTADLYKTWLSNNNLLVYYVLATPTTTEITDTTLIGQLETISKQLAYKGQTNIMVSGNLPVIINAEALKDLSTEETTVASVTRLQSVRPTIIQPEINNIEEQPEEIEEEIPEQE